MKQRQEKNTLLSSVIAAWTDRVKWILGIDKSLRAEKIDSYWGAVVKLGYQQGFLNFNFGKLLGENSLISIF